MSKQFGIKEVCNLNFFDYTTGDPILRVDYAQNSSVKVTGNRLDVRGGQGFYKLLSFDYEKSAEMMLESGIVDTVLLSKLSGKDITTGAATVPKRELLVTAGATPTITLAATPVSGTLMVYKVTDDRDLSTEQVEGTPSSTTDKWSLSGAVLTLNATSCPSGTKIAVYYDYTSAATTETITVTSNAFPGYMRCTGEGIFTDLVSGSSVPVVFDMLKVKPKNDFEITMKSDAVTQLNLTFDLFSVDDSNGDKVYFKYYILQ
jgi:hypothetical protein